MRIYDKYHVVVLWSDEGSDDALLSLFATLVTLEKKVVRLQSLVRFDMEYQTF
jgi:hypothetical protein